MNEFKSSRYLVSTLILVKIADAVYSVRLVAINYKKIMPDRNCIVFADITVLRNTKQGKYATFTS